jgi:hypothetical protein
MRQCSRCPQCRRCRPTSAYARATEAGFGNFEHADEMRTRTNSREVRLLGSGSNSRQLHNATNDANNGGGSSRDAGDTNTGGNNNCSQDSSRRSSRNMARSSRNTARRLEHQIQTLHALQPWLDREPKRSDRGRREVVRDTFSYFNTSTELKAPLVPRVCYPRVSRFVDRVPRS